ncbi:alpha/beta hydrolase [Conexibacter woesei]|uniref:alpha/beta hydrolase n=1 Tax=Conexibacter woesei TaxID=191495 RepID=UPI00041485A7|nr:alpha/beta hydrolase-fold protein [Conexibacter woesei]
MRRFIPLCLAALALLVGVPAAQANTTVLIHTPPGKWINKGSLTPLDLVNGSLDTRVVVPDSYNKSKCSPVLYLLHGTGSDLHPGSIEWFTGGHIDQASVPAITVVPGGGPSWWIDQWSNTARRPAWESWFWNTVMPAVNKRFNICPQRSQHTIAGLSMGGYGALYLASQRPGYFGSAASFSGVISLHRPEWTPYSRFKQLWGDPYGFYALTHDPTTLVDNLKNTRVLIDAGNGDTIGNEALDPSKRLEELEFTAMSEDFVAHAKRAGIDVTYQKHAGIHTWPNWQLSYANFLAWHPFKRVVSAPKRWTMYTASKQGDAWGYQWKMAAFPGSAVKLSYINKTFKAEGYGRMTIVTPQGRTLRGTLPFTIKGKTLKRVKKAKGPLLTTDRPVPVTVTVTPATPTATSPVTVSFKTTEALPASKVYEIGITYTAGGCGQTVIQRVTQPAKGKVVTATLTPPADRPQWCKGSAVAGVLAVGRNTTGFALGDILGYQMLTFR